MRKLPFIKKFIVLSFLFSFFAFGSTKAQTSNYFNGFEIGVGLDDWADVSRVASGTNSITSATGAFHGEVDIPNGGFTRFGHVGGGYYNSAFPCNGYKTSLDIYLDVNGGFANDTRVDYSSAINTTATSGPPSTNNHRRDFIFHLGFYNDATGLGAGTNRFIVSGSNNAPGWPRNPAQPQFLVSTSGWYKFEHSFKNIAGVLSVELNIYNSSNTLIGTITLSDPTDLIGTTVGGARYGWVLNNAFSLLAIDNSSLLINTVTGPVHNITSGLNYCTIQSAIDAASPGDYIKVDAGNYFEKATNRFVFGVNGPHKFGLFIDKNNLTIEGLDASNNTVTNAANAAVVITTNATNNFGSSGIFIQANGVTLKGLKIGDNYDDANVRDNNKTIEVVGDAFAMNKCWISTALDEGAFYMGRWDASHPIESYTLTQNKFENTLISINNGAGLTGPRSGRVITNNEFTGVTTPYLIGFRGWSGAGPVQGWIVDPVGGAVVTGNAFNTTGVDKYVVARGNAGGYINTEFDWSEIWNLNTYGNHVVTLSNQPLFAVRTYLDATGYPETRRISPMIQENVNIGQTGDVVLVSTGTYNESVNINKSLNVRGAQANNCAATRTGLESIINCVNGIGVNASNVTINGFTIQGQTSTNSAPGFGYAVYMAPPNTGTQLLNNIIKNNVVGSSISNAGASPSQVLVQCNWFDSNNQPGPAGGTGIYTDEYTGGGIISNVLINQNKFTGHVNDAGIDFSVSQAALAATGITISNNEFDGNRRAAFLYNVVSSSFANNSIRNSTGAGTGEVRIYGGVNNFTVNNNFFIAGAPHGVRITDDGGINSSNITVTNNSFTGYSNTNFAIENVSGYTGSLSATCNWYGTIDMAVIAPKISGSVTYIPYLINGTDNSTAIGFQPVPNSCIGGIVADIFHTTETCTDFKNGVNGKQLSQLCYTTKANKVSTVTPGQFFYYTAITAPSASFCIDIVQTKTCNSFNFFSIQQNTQITLWDANCVKVAGTTVTGAGGQYRICITNATAGAIYVMSVKYDSKSVNGSSSVGTPTCTYTFESKIGSTSVPNSITSINLVPNCSSSFAPAMNTQVTDFLESPVVKDEFVVNVSPNPSSSDFKIQVISQSSEPILIRIMDAVGAVRSNTFNVAKGSVIMVGNELKNGIYFAEVIQGKNRKVVKLIKQN